MDLLNLCLTSTYFQYNGKHYKQLHGTAMGSPVSFVVAEFKTALHQQCEAGLDMFSLRDNEASGSRSLVIVTKFFFGTQGSKFGPHFRRLLHSKRYNSGNIKSSRALKSSVPVVCDIYELTCVFCLANSR